MTKKLSGLLSFCCAVILCATLAFPQAVQAADAPPEVEAEAYAVTDATTGQLLVSKQGDIPEYPASITKIMTVALTLEAVAENYPEALDEQVEVSNEAVEQLIYGAAHISLTGGEVATLRDLLYAAQVASANDAANALAEYTSGSIEAFADRMNQKVAELGLANTHFVNPSGLPHPQHYTTASDMAVITSWALTVPGFRELFAAPSYDMPPTNKQPATRTLNASNLMLVPGSAVYREGVTGSKTGYTNEARYTLATTVKRGDTELVCIVLKCDRNAIKYEATDALLDYCFDNFTRVSFPLSGAEPGSVPVFGGGDNSLGNIDVFGEGETSLLLHNSLTTDNIETVCTMPERYIIGESFAPTVTLLLKEPYAMQERTLVSAPLKWSGLDEILAKNTTHWESVFVGLINKQNAYIWGPLAGILLLACLFAGRVLYVRRRREKRRLARLEYVRSRMPVRIAERPEPPRQRRPVPKYAAYTNKAASPDGPRRTAAIRPDLQVVGYSNPPPRRAGRR